MSLEQLQATLDEQKQNMPEGTYLSLCNLSKDVHELLAGKDKEIAEKDKEITEKDKEITPKKRAAMGDFCFIFSTRRPSCQFALNRSMNASGRLLT